MQQRYHNDTATIPEYFRILCVLLFAVVCDSARHWLEPGGKQRMGGRWLGRASAALVLPPPRSPHPPFRPGRTSLASTSAARGCWARPLTGLLTNESVLGCDAEHTKWSAYAWKVMAVCLCAKHCQPSPAKKKKKKQQSPGWRARVAAPVTVGQCLFTAVAFSCCRCSCPNRKGAASGQRRDLDGPSNAKNIKPKLATGLALGSTRPNSAERRLICRKGAVDVFVVFLFFLVAQGSSD